MITYEFNRLGISDWHKPPEPVHYDVSSVVLSVIDETKSMAPITSGLSAYVNGQYTAMTYESRYRRYSVNLSIEHGKLFSFKLTHVDYLTFNQAYYLSSLNGSLITMMSHSGGHSVWSTNSDLDTHLIIQPKDHLDEIHEINFFNHNVGASSTQYKKDKYIYGKYDSLSSTGGSLTAYIDRDATDRSGGGETMIIDPISKEYVYTFITYDYAKVCTSTGKKATLQIQIGDDWEESRDIYPACVIVESDINKMGADTGAYWEVCKIEDGNIYIINKLTDQNTYGIYQERRDKKTNQQLTYSNTTKKFSPTNPYILSSQI